MYHMFSLSKFSGIKSDKMTNLVVWSNFWDSETINAKKDICPFFDLNVNLEVIKSKLKNDHGLSKHACKFCIYVFTYHDNTWWKYPICSKFC